MHHGNSIRRQRAVQQLDARRSESRDQKRHRRRQERIATELSCRWWQAMMKRRDSRAVCRCVRVVPDRNVIVIATTQRAREVCGHVSDRGYSPERIFGKCPAERQCASQLAVEVNRRTRHSCDNSRVLQPRIVTLHENDVHEACVLGQNTDDADGESLGFCARKHRQSVTGHSGPDVLYRNRRPRERLDFGWLWGGALDNRGTPQHMSQRQGETECANFAC